MEGLKVLTIENDGQSTSTTINPTRIEGMPFQKKSVSPSSDFEIRVENAKKTVSFMVDNFQIQKRDANDFEDGSSSSGIFTPISFGDQ